MDNLNLLKRTLPFLFIFFFSVGFAVVRYTGSISRPSEAQEQELTLQAIEDVESTSAPQVAQVSAGVGEENAINALFNHMLNLIDQILMGGLLDATDPLTFPNDQADNGDPLPSTSPTGPNPPDPGPNPDPNPNPGKPSKSRITLQNMSDANEFFNKLSGICPVVNYGNYQSCIDSFSANIPADRLKLGKQIARDEISALKSPFQCGSFTKAIYGVFTGEKFTTAYTTKTNYVKYLSEPFWKFTYYPRHSTTPAIGDLVKWTNGEGGHVAIVTDVINDNTFMVMQANLSASRNAACPGCLTRSSVNRFEAGLAGFYRLEQ